MLSTPDSTEARTRHPNRDVTAQSQLRQTCQQLHTMLLSLLLFVQVGCEWVEISQQHYRKPMRPTHNHPLVSKVDKVTEDDPEETTVINRIYLNNTLSDYNWRGDVQRTPSTGNRRIQLGGSNVKTNSNQDKITNEFHNYELENERSNEGSYSGTVQKVPNIGSIKRVQLENSPVKSPSINMKPLQEKERTNALTNYEEKLEVNKKTGPDLNKEIHHSYPNKNAFSRSAERVPVVPTENRINIEEDKPLDIINHSNHDLKKVSSFNIIKPLNKGNDNENILKYDPKHPITKTSEANTKKDSIKKHEFKNITYINSTVTDRIEPKINKFNSNKGPDEEKTETSPNTKVNTIENVVKFMKVVADTMSSHTKRSFNSKLTYLQGLRDTILFNIEDRIDETWPDDIEDAGSRRRSRSAHAAPRGHVEFPSSEGALMTISFLTFAVFLIKLVLQVIHTYKNKAMMVAPLVVAAAGRNASKK